MELVLRPYQSRDIRALQELISCHRSVVYQLPTGGGKTLVAGFIAQKARALGNRIMFVVHRKELIGQFYETLCEAGLDFEVGIVSPDYPPTPWAPIQLVMVRSAVLREGFLQKFRPHLIVIDEGHHAVAGSYLKLLAAHPDAKVLLLTATPRRLDGKGLKRVADAIHCGPTTRQLIKWGYLSPVDVKDARVGLSIRGLKVRGGEYSASQLDERANDKVVAAGAAAYLKYARGLPTIFFGVSVRHSKRTAEALRAHGVPAEHVDGTTLGRSRKHIMGAFKARDLLVLCNVDIVSEGFDAPGCYCVMDMQPTLSTSRFLQKAGRALRFEQGKRALFLDGAGNVFFHKHPIIEREWSLEDAPKRKGRKSRAPAGGNLRVCAECYSVFEPQAVCPTCGAEHDGRPVKEIDAEFFDVPEQPPPKPKAKINKADRAELGRECRVLVARGMPREAWLKLSGAGAEAGYSPRWAHMLADIYRIPPDVRA